MKKHQFLFIPFFMGALIIIGVVAKLRESTFK